MLVEPFMEFVTEKHREVREVLGLFVPRFYSPPRRIHSRGENEQEENENEIGFRDVLGLMWTFGLFPAPHG